MQQFTIPQFIDVEDKIIGPVTTRQFVIILTGMILIALFYRLFDLPLFVILSIIDFTISMVFSFVKINGRPFHFFVLNVVQTLKRPKMRIWSNTVSSIFKEEAAFDNLLRPNQPAPVKHYNVSRLAELSLMVDTGGAFEGDEDDKPTIG